MKPDDKRGDKPRKITKKEKWREIVLSDIPVRFEITSDKALTK